MEKAGGHYEGVGKLETPYPLILDRYPCLLDQAGKGHRVRGEVYRLEDPEGWKHLDWLENHPEEYIRRLENVRLNDRQVVAWTYFYRWPEQLQGELTPVEEFKIG